MGETALDYHLWNRALLERFFHKAHRHRAVRMRLDEEVLERLGGSRAELVSAVIAECDKQGAADIQALGKAQLSKWVGEVALAQEEGREVPNPPFMPILGLYVLAVNHGGDAYAPHDYYNRLHELLGRPASRIRSIKPSIGLWSALTDWSSRMLGGRLGVFEHSIVGRQVPVGFPRRQVLLASREVPDLKDAFIAHGILPGSSPTDAELLQAARGAPGLLSRTNRLLDLWPAGDAQELLAEIRSELDGWDRLEEASIHSAPGARLPLRVALTASGRRIVDWFLETDTIPGLTDGERLVGPDGPTPIACSIELVPIAGTGRSKLCDSESGGAWKPSGGLLSSVSLSVQGTGFVVERRSAARAIFGTTSRPGLLRELGQAELEAGRSYLLVAAGGEVSTGSFVGRFEGSWEALEFEPRLQKRVFVAASTTHEPRSSGIEFVGGFLTLAGTRSYVPFALPDVRVVPGGSAAPILLVQYFDEAGRGMGSQHQLPPVRPGSEDSADELLRREESNSCIVPLPTPPPDAFTCEVQLDVEGETAPRKVIFLDVHPGAGSNSDLAERDALGRIATEGSTSTLRGVDVLQPARSDPPMLPLESKPCLLGEPTRSDEPGIRVMHLIRACTPLRWSRGREGLQSCLDPARMESLDPGRLAFEVSVMHALGILEIREGSEVGWDRLHAIPPSLVVLPSIANLGTGERTGLRQGEQALLIGCWLGREIEALRREARRQGVILLESPHDPKLQLVPHRRVLIAEGEHGVDRIARLGNVIGRPWPQGCRFAGAIDSLTSIVDAEGWIRGGLSDAWRKRYFDPRTLSVTDGIPDGADRFLLVECAHPERPGWRFFVVDRADHRRLQLADRQLARWFVRTSALPECPVPECGGELILPWELRLPRIVERILALASGRRPWLKRFAPGRSPFLRDIHARMFRIPRPPDEPVPWFESRSFCSGNLVCYPQAYGTLPWPKGNPLPMIGARAERISGANMEG